MQITSNITLYTCWNIYETFIFATGKNYHIFFDEKNTTFLWLNYVHPTLDGIASRYRFRC